VAFTGYPVLIEKGRCGNTNSSTSNYPGDWSGRRSNTRKLELLWIEFRTTVAAPLSASPTGPHSYRLRGGKLFPLAVVHVMINIEPAQCALEGIDHSVMVLIEFWEVVVQKFPG